MSSYDPTGNYGDIFITGGTFTFPNGTVSLTDDLTLAAAATIYENNTTLNFVNPFGSIIDLATTFTFTNLIINSVGSTAVAISSGDTLIVSSTLTLTNGATSGTGILEFTGTTLNIASTWDSMANGAFNLTGTQNQTLDLTGVEGGINSDLNINKTSGTVTLNSGLTMDAASQDLTIIEGTLDLNGNTLIVNGTSATMAIQDGGILRMQGGETVTTNASYPTFAATSNAIVYGAGTYTLPSLPTFYNLSFTGGGTYTMSTSTSISNDLTLSSGTLSTNGKNLTVSGTFSNDGTLQIQGGETVTLTNDANSGTVEYIGDGDSGVDEYIIAITDFYDFSINFTDSGDSLTPSVATTTITNNLTIAGGTYSVNGTINLSGNLLNTGGTFTANSSTLNLVGTDQTISGENTFYNLTKTDTSSSTLTFPASTTTTISNALTLTGSATTTPLFLRSSISDTSALIDIQGTQSLQYLDVKDMTSASQVIASCTTGCTDSTNNLYWSFEDLSIQFTNTTLNGLESVTSVDIEISLNAPAVGDITVDYAVSGGGATGSGTDYTLSSGTSTITNGNTTTSITLIIVDDSEIELNETIEITISNPNGGTLGSNTVYTYTITDDDVAGVTINLTSVAVTEGSTTADYTAVLDTQPTNDVDVSASLLTNQVTLSSSTLTFTNSNWNTPQTITVTAINDDIAEGEHTDTISHTSSSTDSNFNLLTIASVTSTITDNETAGVTITTTTLALTEGGTTFDYTIQLDSEPTNVVAITLSSSGSNTTFSTSTITFTNTNWNTPQSITVSAVDNAVVDGTHLDTISHTAVSSDGNYSGISIVDVIATITDNDSAGVTIALTTVSVTEGSTTDSYTAVLDSQPTNDVTVDMSLSTNQVTISTSSITFTSANWNTPQTITITAVDDNIAEGNHTDTISHVSTSADSNFNSISIPVVTVNITDNETANVIITTTTLALTEGSTTFDYDIQLDSEPTNDVVLTLSSTNSNVTISDSTLTFTSSNWNTPQTITITAVDNSTVDGTHTDTITHTSASSDPNYDTITIADVTATITDNDVEAPSSNNNPPNILPPPPAPITPPVVVPTPPTSLTTEFFLQELKTFTVGASFHSVFVSRISKSSITVTIESDPIILELEKGISQQIDSDKDGVLDLEIEYVEYINEDSVKINLINLTDESELSNPVIINYGAYTTQSRDVTITFNILDAEQMAISNTSDFANSIFQPFQNSTNWTLTTGDEIKTVYAKFLSNGGTTSVYSDTIRLNEGFTLNTNTSTDNVTPEETPTNTTCSLTPNTPYKTSNSPSVYYITEECTKRPFLKSYIYFTYFDSWSSLKITTQTELEQTPTDTQGFMPLGPKYDPKENNVLVKTSLDPMVYLFSGKKLFKIESESIFNKLNYSWSWIEKVNQSLINQYQPTETINYTDHHPNYTLIKYPDRPEVYRLEPDPSDETKQIKRHIKDPQTFNNLHFRWDRIVTIQYTELYESGVRIE